MQKYCLEDDDAIFVLTQISSTLEFEKEKAVADMVSEKIKVPEMGSGASDAAYLSSVTSLIARLPAFDFVEHKQLAYLRIKSD